MKQAKEKLIFALLIGLAATVAVLSLLSTSNTQAATPPVNNTAGSNPLTRQGNGRITVATSPTNVHSAVTWDNRGAENGEGACTIAVATFSSTVDGRPVLWKNRDYYGRTDTWQSILFWHENLYVGFAVQDTQVETSALDWNDDSVSIIFNNGEFRRRQDVGGTGEGACDRALHLPACTTLNDSNDTDCGYTVEMRIRWSQGRITVNANDVLPTDLLLVEVVGNSPPQYGYWDDEW
jgi:hypothetical protein